MKYEEVIKHYGSVRNTADALGITTQCVYRWESNFPISSQALVYLETQGKLLIDGDTWRKKK